MVRQLALLLALQGAITMVVAGVVLVWGHSANGVSALLGGAAAAAAAFAFGIAYWVQGGDRSRKPFRAFLVAELCRVGSAVAMLGAGMVMLPGEAAIVFLGAFIAALMAYLVIFLF